MPVASMNKESVNLVLFQCDLEGIFPPQMLFVLEKFIWNFIPILLPVSSGDNRKEGKR